MTPVSVFCVLAFLLACQVPQSQSCFPVDMFEHSFRWLQSITLHKRLYVYIDQEEPRHIRMESEGEQKQRKINLKCLHAYSDQRYMVRVEEVYQPIYYHCIKFQQLSKYVIRISKTKARVSKKKVNCETEMYMEDEAVIFAYEVPPQPCPLSGGYQLVMHQGRAIDGACLDTVQGYNPRVQFECDISRGGNVMVEFGRFCEPSILTRSQKMRGRHITKLRCLGSWEESGYSSVLLQMENSEVNVWCLHYRQQRHSRSTVTSDGEEFLSAFLTLDGRCSGEAFVNEDMPRNSSMFGSLASYRPGSDLKCTEEGYLQNCKLREDRCFESSECPDNCHRCIKPVEKRACEFDENTRGQWELVYSFDNLTVSIGQNSLKGSAFGDFECRGPAESSLPGNVFPVVQRGTSATCMPYYACAQVLHLAPGMLAFNLRAVVRDAYTGAPHSCVETHNAVGHIVPIKLQRTLTLLDRKRLQEVPCQVQARTFPTMVGECRIAVDQCDGDCQTLTVDYDEKTCNYSGSNPFNIEHEHKCYAHIFFRDGIEGILAKTADSDKFLCWVFSPTRLFITIAEKCNQEGVTAIYNDRDAAVSYDPLNAISRPVSGSSTDYNNGSQLSVSFLSQIIKSLWSLFWVFWFFV
ncbi:uncharacterized protein LOC101846705 [Aplysia californica]|uniref:Uncharacterized protein LOC101846705 n=1 Tax=Aplysia californica TaxID=6500 RepID=A0ABM1A1L5_APLCA|nr:uncharacterized protein LOC101846705 [Aplysia californica]